MADGVVDVLETVEIQKKRMAARKSLRRILGSELASRSARHDRFGRPVSAS
ncbi:hypothetical protein ACFS07_12850 [Undibacterium arcticum]